MAKLGFSIGRALNLGAKFATGAGAFDSIGGAQNKLLDVGKDLIGGGNRANAGASLSDRLRGGLSAVSPGFAQAEGLRANITSQGITDTLNQQKIEEMRTASELVSVDKLIGTTMESGAKDIIIQKLEQRGLITVDPNTGQKMIVRGNAQEALKEFTDTPEEQRELAQANLDSVAADLKKEQLKGKAELDKQAKALARTQGLDIDTMDSVTRAEFEREVLGLYQSGALTSPVGKTIQANAESLQKRQAQWQARLDGIEKSITTRLQESQILKNKAEATGFRNEEKAGQDLANIMSSNGIPTSGELATEVLSIVDDKADGADKALGSKEVTQDRQAKERANITKLNKVNDNLERMNQAIASLPPSILGQNQQKINNTKIAMNAKSIQLFTVSSGKTTEAETKALGRENLDAMIQDAVVLWSSLETSEGLISDKNGFWRNLANFIETLPGGGINAKLFGGESGRERAGLRDQINSIEPGLLLGIKNATGLTGKQMDSDKELQFYKQQTGNLRASLESNAAALQIMSELYGNGTQLDFGALGIEPDIIKREMAKLKGKFRALSGKGDKKRNDEAEVSSVLGGN